MGDSIWKHRKDRYNKPPCYESSCSKCPYKHGCKNYKNDTDWWEDIRW